MCPPQVAEEDLQRVAQATGALVQTTVNNLDPKVLGTCTKFEERQVCRLPCRRRPPKLPATAAAPSLWPIASAPISVALPASLIAVSQDRRSRLQTQ